MPESTPVTQDQYIPAAIAKMADRLEQSTGQQPRITRTSPLHFLLTLTNDRVCLTITWRRDGQGAWKWKHSTLAVDGKDRELARDYDDFIRIWNDPDQADAPPPVAALPALTPLEDESVLPGVIQRTLRSVRAAEDAQVTVAASERGYTLQVTGPSSTMRINYVKGGRTDYSWGPDPRNPFQVYDAYGVERTEHFSRDLNTALAQILGTASAPTVPSQLGNPRSSSVQNSVQVRRHSVIRV
ncbi:hypothetical protein ABZW18_34595 [Streptomyces sp. NPDC004647]|uniref:hypothetical protein n=1 Tax=Streptomyces sp. NPDC004647 TaxID=3154671 RepID=UPI0033BC4FD4